MIHQRRQSSRRWQLVLLEKHTNVTYRRIEISTLCLFLPLPCLLLGGSVLIHYLPSLNIIPFIASTPPPHPRLGRRCNVDSSWRIQFKPIPYLRGFLSHLSVYLTTFRGYIIFPFRYLPARRKPYIICQLP